LAPHAYRFARPWFESPFLEAELAARRLTPARERQARSLAAQGYLVLESLLPETLLDRVVEEMLPRFANDVAEGPRSRVRVTDEWRQGAAIRALAAHPEVLALLRDLYGREPFPFQTLNFQYGTEQRAHQDQAFFDSYPAGYMCALWVALEDVSPENGSLFYYPGSHLLPPWTYDDLALGFRNPASPRGFDFDAARLAAEAALVARLDSAGLERRVFSARRGTALLWAAGLAHGGSPILRPGATRYSQVTHYFFRDCCYLTPIYSNPLTGDVYLRRVEDAASGATVPHRYQGLEVEGVAENGLYKLLFDLGPNGEDRLRALANERIRGLELIERSGSFRLGRALTAPARWLRRR
jgi:hypothetical protein